LALLDSKTLAIINDNDFGVGSATTTGDGKLSGVDDTAPVKLGLISLNNPVSLAGSTKALAFDTANRLDLREEKGRANIQFTATHDSTYNNYVGLYQVDDVDGTVGGLKPGQTGYVEAALNRSLLNILKKDDKTTYLSGGALYAPYLIANSSIANGSPDAVIKDFIDKNKLNAQLNELKDVHAYFAFKGANTDGVDHIKSLGTDKFGFEDMWKGGDNDFNDAILQIKRV
jgi:Domain of unknown function (DUF4114)